MNDLYKIVNFKNHPIIGTDSYIQKCRNTLKAKSVLILDNFLTKNALKNLQKEANFLHKKAFYCSQKHTILLNKKNDQILKNDPCNIEVKSDKGCVPHDLIPNKSYLNIIYRSEVFKKFIKTILNVRDIYSYKDNLSSINYNYYEQFQQLGWHFDNATFAITLMINAPIKGGEFQYINKGRNVEKNYINKKLINSVLNGTKKTNTLKVKPGTLILFYGQNYLHRVTPVESKKGRILVTLNYNLKKNIELTKNARKTFFGRIN
jgi:hypothetical protein